MPQPAHFKQVIETVLDRYGNLENSQLADKIIDALDLADAIMGNGPSQPQVRIQTPAPRYREVDQSQALIIGGAPSAARIVEEAPPVAMVRNPDAAPVWESEAEIERKKSVLHNEILSKLPPSITVDLPALGRQLTLIRYVKPSPAGMNFIRLLYGQHADEEDGPQVQLSTADPALDLDAIKSSILKQAEMRYRKERQRIEPRKPPPTSFPTEAEMEMAVRANPSLRTDEATSSEERADWNRLTNRNI